MTGEPPPVRRGRGGLRALRERAAERLHAWLRSRTRWLSGRAAFEEGARPLIVILGREHCRERTVFYPIHSRADLRKVLRNEFAATGRKLCWVNPQGREGFRVSLWEPDAAVLPALRAALWIVPETFLLARAVKGEQVIEVNSGGADYFFYNDGARAVSALRSALTPNAAVFAAAAGAAATAAPGVIARDELAELLAAGLRRMEPRAWLRFLNPEVFLRVRRAPWAAIAAYAGTAFAAYLLLSTVYLYGALHAAQAQSQRLSAQTAALLKQQRALERNAAQYRALASLLNGRPLRFRAWDVVDALGKAGARVNSVRMDGGRLLVTGSAAQATAALAAAAGNPLVEDPRFEAPTRRQGNQEQFEISFRLREP